MEDGPPAAVTGSERVLAALEILKQCKAEDFREGIEITFKVKTDSGVEQDILLSLRNSSDAKCGANLRANHDDNHGDNHGVKRFML